MAPERPLVQSTGRDFPFEKTSGGGDRQRKNSRRAQAEHRFINHHIPDEHDVEHRRDGQGLTRFIRRNSTSFFTSSLIVHFASVLVKYFIGNCAGSPRLTSSC